MGIFNKIREALSGGESGDRDILMIYVRCGRCGETLESRINLNNDLSIQYGEANQPNTYLCRKTLVGSRRCFQRVEVALTFDSRRKLIDRQITGGEFSVDNA